MDLTSAQANRAAGVLLGQAIGDALGVPYEFTPPIAAGEARMIGGGLGPYAPGEWSDDTQMALCIARSVTDSTSSPVDPDVVARHFMAWRAEGATDVGTQISTVLHETTHRHVGTLSQRMTAAAQEMALRGRAGNGALMRTGVVGLVALDDPVTTARIAQRIAALTHPDERCLDSCVLWSEAVRTAVLEGRLDIRGGLELLPDERRDTWHALIEEAEARPPSDFTPNGYTVTAFQAAWSAIHATSHVSGPDHVEAALQAAIAIGNDTDTVAAIAGSLLGARYGISGLRTDLARRVHGWPGMRGYDVALLGRAIAQGLGADEPAPTSFVTGAQRSLAVPHPHDREVILGTEADLARCPELGVTAVVSLSRVGPRDIAPANIEPDKHVRVRLIDSEDPADNADLAWTLDDAARTVASLRADGERVLLHCVAAHHRTPSVALAYSRLLGLGARQAAAEVQAALGRRVDGLLWHTAATMTQQPAGRDGTK